MSDPKFHAQWKSKTAFAEVAEALGVDTDHILAMTSPPGRPHVVLVMFSKELPTNTENMTQGEMEAHDVYKAAFERDDDGILRLFHGPEIEPGFWRGLRVALEEE